MSAGEHAAAAQRALQGGDLATAIDRSQRALRADGTRLDAMLTLARALLHGGQRDNAVDVLTRATSVHPRAWQAHFHLAQALHMKSVDHTRARAAYERAMELNPGFAGTHAALAKLCEEVNELDDARRHADRAIELAPDDPACLLAAALVDRRTGEHRAAVDRLRSVLDHDARAAQLPPITRALAHRSFGQSLDALGEHERARGAFARAHAERWSMPDGRRVDPRRALDSVDAARRNLEPGTLRAWAGAEPSPGDAAPVFLIGFPRSGTTLTEQILGCHPGVVTLDENSPLSDVSRALAPRAPSGHAADALGGVGEGDARALRARYAQGADLRLERAGAGPRSGRLLIDKLPLNIVQLPVIARVFPDARLIVAIRDPRDVCVSCLSQVMTPNAEMAHLRSIESAAAYYARVMALWLDARAHVPNAYHESRYEDLVSDPEASIRGLTDFLGLAWDDALLRHHELVRGKAISTPSYEAVGSPIARGAAGRWRQHADAFEDVGDALDRFLDAFGYER